MSDRACALADLLNRECDCVGTDVPALQHDLDSALAAHGMPASIRETHPHLFAAAPVFVAPSHVRRMREVVDAVEAVVSLPAWREAVLGPSEPIARVEQATRGALLGFDFHISPDGPKLIEINTNAGGALLNVAARRAQQACCPEVAGYLDRAPGAAHVEEKIFQVFLREWRLARGDRPLSSIAIVDDGPQRQYLYPEFLLFQRLFESRGVSAVIADPAQLQLSDGRLVYDGRTIDLVYNRLTDFYFADACHSALRAAYLSDVAVFTPHPRAHALYSSKRNLALLSDGAALRAMGASDTHIQVLLESVPRTVAVDGSEAQWWQDRKAWFFKPAEGYGSRGTYRGDKITRRAFAEVVSGGYVAQELTPPSERWTTVGPERVALKVDVRNYVYDGEPLLMAARLYQGQTTNFRTAGGGFAPVLSMPQVCGPTVPVDVVGPPRFQLTPSPC